MLQRTALLVMLGLLGACASQPAPSDNWTRWVCDSQAEVLWRFADSSRESMDVRLGGGDTLAAIDKYGVAANISYISTGGGAFLEFVEGKVLPAVEVLEQRAK